MNIYPEKATILAPLAGYTDIPYRNSAYRHGCKFAFTEMIDAASLVYQRAKSIRFLDRDENEKWLGAQLVGVKPEMLGKATEILNGYNIDLIDFNLGCPVPKVARKGAGAQLAKDLDKTMFAFDAIIKNAKYPVTVKTRILSEETIEPSLILAKKLEDAGAKAITIHGRIMLRFYGGPVFTKMISTINEELKIPVIANGGVMGNASACELRKESSCDKIMVARGAMGNPWIFNEIANPADFKFPTAAELADEMALHIGEMITYYGEELALKISRKMLLDYMKSRGYGGALKKSISTLKTQKELDVLICDIRKGPSERYWQWLKNHPQSDRQLRLI